MPPEFFSRLCHPKAANAQGTIPVPKGSDPSGPFQKHPVVPLFKAVSRRPENEMAESCGGRGCGRGRAGEPSIPNVVTKV